MSDDDGRKTRRLDDEYFKEIAKQAKTQKIDGDKTQILGSPSGSAAGTTDGPASVPDGNRTRVFQPGSDGASEATPFTSAMDDPPTGWLVSIDGPGIGTVMTLGLGLNTVGRGPDPRVSIPFDDDSISRGKCFVVVYDPVNKKFFVTPGEGKTLTYVGTNPV